MNTLKKISDPSGRVPVRHARKILIIKWLPLFIYSFIVILGAVTPASRIPAIFNRMNDKVIHGAEFFLLFWFAIYASEQKNKRYRLIFAFLYCAAMSALTELLQFSVPSRSMSGADILADAAGFCTAGFLLILFTKKEK